MSSPLVLMLAHSDYANDPRIRREAEALVAAGYRVRACGTSRDGTPRRHSLDGVEVVETDVAKTREGLLSYGRQYLATTWACAREVHRARRDGLGLVQVHTLPDFLVWATLPAKLRGTPVLLDLHESMSDFFDSKFRGRRGARFALELLERHCASLSTELLTVNDEIADVFERRFGRRPTVVMNTVDEERFGPARRELLWPEGPKTLGYHGTLTGIYGLDLMVAAMPAVLRAHPGTRVEIFGDGPERPRLEALAREHGVVESIRFAGRVPLHEMPKHLGGIHLGVVPTRKDAFLDMSLGTKLLEYVYLGAPVVTSNLRAVERTFPGDSLTTFAGNDPVDLATKIIDVLGTDRKVLGRRVESARAVYRGLAWPVMAERYVALVDRLTHSDKMRRLPQ